MPPSYGANKQKEPTEFIRKVEDVFIIAAAMHHTNFDHMMFAQQYLAGDLSDVWRQRKPAGRGKP
jgi:hypothetical protein